MEHPYIHPQGLHPLKEDKRDFRRSVVFGAIPSSQLPIIDFTVGDIVAIKDQKTTDFCTGCGTTGINELQECVGFSFEYQISKIKQILGDWKGYGADLRTAVQSLCTYGSLPKNLAPFTVDNQPRDFLANWNNWPKALDDQALLYKKQSFFSVTTQGYVDLFDAIRGTLWQKKEQKDGVLTGMNWHQAWTYGQGGIVPAKYGSLDTIGGHCFYFIGQKMINGVPYLIAVNSWGEGYGDKGKFYFPREVVNREAIFGNFTVEDMPVNIAMKYNKNGISVTDGELVKLWKMLITALNLLKK